jgi:hypothetical protein
MNSSLFICPHCRRRSTPRTIRIKHGIHLFLTIITAGLWAVSWLALVLSRRVWPIQCHRCGARLPAQAAESPSEAKDLTPALELVAYRRPPIEGVTIPAPAAPAKQKEGPEPAAYPFPGEQELCPN